MQFRRTQAGTADLEMGDTRCVPGAGVRSPARSPFVRSASSIDGGRGVPLMDFEKDKKQVCDHANGCAGFDSSRAGLRVRLPWEGMGGELYIGKSFFSSPFCAQFTLARKA